MYVMRDNNEEILNGEYWVKNYYMYFVRSWFADVLLVNIVF